MTAPTEAQLEAIAGTFVGRLNAVADLDFTPAPPSPRRNPRKPPCSVCAAEGSRWTVILAGPNRRPILTRLPLCDEHARTFDRLHRDRRPELAVAGLPVLAFNPAILDLETLETTGGRP